MKKFGSAVHVVVIVMIEDQKKGITWYERIGPLTLPLWPAPNGEIIRFVVGNDEYYFKTVRRLSLQPGSPIVPYVLVPLPGKKILTRKDFHPRFWRKLEEMPE